MLVKNRAKELKYGFILILVTIVLFFVFFEAILQINGLITKEKIIPDNTTLIHQKSDNQVLIYELAPNKETIYKGVTLKTNSLGMRDYEYSIKKLDAYRIAMVGDSIVFGVGVPLAHSIPKQLESILKTEKNIEVLNFGVAGYTTEKEIVYIKEKILKFEPDLIILIYAMNDIYDINNGIDKFFQDSPDKCMVFAKVPIPCFIKSILTKIKTVNFIVGKVRAMMIQGINDDYYENIYKDKNNLARHDSDFKDLASLSKNTPLFFFIHPLLVEMKDYKWVNAHNTVSNLLIKNNIPYHDLLVDLQNYNLSSFRYDQNDILHPNKEANTLTSSIIKDVLEKNNLLPE
tara:strand:- start:5107 stop:6141 length:1035 start_codon:yes stop_codon:yes gene_type:complete